MSKSVYMSQHGTDPEDALLLTVAQVGACLQVSRPTVYGLIRSGQLRCVRFGKAYRVPRDAVDEFIRRASGLEDGDGVEGYPAPRALEGSDVRVPGAPPIDGVRWSAAPGRRPRRRVMPATGTGQPTTADPERGRHAQDGNHSLRRRR